MAEERSHSRLDKLLMHVDQAIRTLNPKTPVHLRPSPAIVEQESELTHEQRKHIAGLMRVNHTGEICAQALYQGQALTAKLPEVRQQMELAAREEVDHLAWCSERVKELGSRTSLLNPMFYGLSFGLGAVAGLVSDKVSLGFVAAIEDQVCQHLENHLVQVPESDEKSRAILDQMLIDEAKHSKSAIEAGGYQFPLPIKTVMTVVSKVMTKTTYRI